MGSGNLGSPLPRMHSAAFTPAAISAGGAGASLVGSKPARVTRDWQAALAASWADCEAFSMLRVSE